MVVVRYVEIDISLVGAKYPKCLRASPRVIKFELARFEQRAFI